MGRTALAGTLVVLLGALGQSTANSMTITGLTPATQYHQANNWGGANGFTANVTVTNTGTAALTGWTLAFAFSSGQRVTDGWSATWNQPAGSANVTAVNMPWNANIPSNGSTSIGFNGSHTGTNTAPASFTLNGNSCTTA